jgi:predicted nucleotidyltransferase
MSLAHFLLGQTRSAVLGALYLHPDASLHVRELARLTGASAGSLHRDLRAMAGLGLIERREVGRQVHYRANRACPVFQELAGLLRKTSGLADVLREALVPLADRIDFAFVHGSVARGEEHGHSDIDLMVVGDVDFAQLVLELAPVRDAVQREVNPAVYGPAEFERKLQRGDDFVAQVWSGPKLWLIEPVGGPPA